MGPSRRPPPRQPPSGSFSSSNSSSNNGITPSSSSSSSSLAQGSRRHTSPSSYFSPVSASASSSTQSPIATGHTVRMQPFPIDSSRGGGSVEGSSRKVAAMNRASMACVSCREAKHRCDGHPPAQLLGAQNSSNPPRSQVFGERAFPHPKLYPADQRCTRCNLNDIECLWAPKAKLGRPAKKTAVAASPLMGAERTLDRGGRGASSSGRTHTSSSSTPTASIAQGSASQVGQAGSFLHPRDDEMSFFGLPQNYPRHSLYQQAPQHSVESEWIPPSVGAYAPEYRAMNLPHDDSESQANSSSSWHPASQASRSPLPPVLSTTGAPASTYRHQAQPPPPPQLLLQSHGTPQHPLSSPPQPPPRAPLSGTWSPYPDNVSQRSAAPSNIFGSQYTVNRGQYIIPPGPDPRQGQITDLHHHQQPFPSVSPSSNSPVGSISRSLSGSMSGSMSYSATALFPSQLRGQGQTSPRAQHYGVHTAPFPISPTIPTVTAGATIAATAHSHSDPYTIRIGMQHYFSSAPRYCLALAPCQQDRLFASLEKWAWMIAEQPRAQLPEEARDFLTLAQTIAAVGWKLARDGSASILHDLFLQQARDGLGGIISRPSNGYSSNSTTQIVSCLQALILGSTLEYALADIDRSGNYMQKAADIVIELGLPVFDVVSPTEGSRAGDRTAQSTGLSAPLVPDMGLADDIRRCFWELCVTQTMFCAATSGDASMCLLRSSIPIEVRFPDSPPPSGETDYGLRIRAASLLLESVQSVPANPSARLNRLESLNDVVTDLAQQAKYRFHNGLTEESVEMTYTAYVMLNSARIQLTRMTFFPTLYQELESSALNDDGTAGWAALTAALPIQVARATIRTIIQAADNIVDLTRSDNSHRPAFSNLYGSARLPVTPVLNHSPFHESFQLTASFAYVTAAALWKDLIESTPFRRDDARLATVARAASTSRALVNALSIGLASGSDGSISQSPPKANMLDDDGNEGSTSGGSNNDISVVWTHNKVLSNLEFAHSILVTTSHVWPMAGKLAAEVANCRILVDRRAPLDG